MNLTVHYSYVTISRPTRSAGSGNAVYKWQVLKFKEKSFNAMLCYYDNISASGFVHSLVFVCVEIVGDVCLYDSSSVRGLHGRDGKEKEGVGT